MRTCFWAICTRECKNMRKQLRNIKKVLEINPANANAFTLLGNIYVMQHDLRSAVSCYKQAVDILPENDEIKLIYLEIVQEYINKKNEEAANAA